MSRSGKTLRVGLVGAGYIAPWHLRALRCLGQVEVAAIADVDLRRAQSFAAANGVRESYDKVETMLDACSLDVVHVLTPPSFHYATAAIALDRGVHVLLEKPMCLEHRECLDLVERAKRNNAHVGVSHNFLFDSDYERLRDAIAAGEIGPIDHVSIVWNKPLDALTSNATDAWMFRTAGNIALEIGPHPVAHAIDLIGYPDKWSVQTENPVDLSHGTRFYRRWRVGLSHDKAAADILLSFNPGFPEHYLHVRGSHGTATVDFLRQTYVLDRSTRFGLDFDRFFRVAKAGRTLRRQAFGNLMHYVLSKFHVSRRGNSFGASIERSLQTFYGVIDGKPDPRMSPEFSANVVKFCKQLADEVHDASGAEQVSVKSQDAAKSAFVGVGATTSNGRAKEVATTLVLGGTGFIGKELVAKLVEANHRVRVLTRRRSSPGGVFDHPNVELVTGDIADPQCLERIMTGVDYVVHLARAYAKRWVDYHNEDVLGTKRVAEACLAAGVKRMLYTGTIDSYYAGPSAGVINEDTPLDTKIRRRNYYARAKYEAEGLLLEMHQQQSLPVVILRPGIVLGAGGSPFHWGVGMWSANSSCQLWGAGDNPLPVVLVSDVVKALIAAIETPGIEGESFNLVGPSSLTARQYVVHLQQSVQARLDVRATPIWKFYLTDMAKWCIKCLVRHPDRRLPSYHDWQSRTQRAQFDCAKARRVLNWHPTTDPMRIVNDGIVAPAKELSA
jgi:nucleoside-diphosphate-sugar epimerase/predicted dehydrogenase